MNAKTRTEIVNQKVQEIRVHYNIGKKILEEITANATYGEGQFDKLAEEYSINADTLRKARQFAKDYTETELNDLCSSILRIQSTQASKSGIFGVSHINRIVSVKGRARKSLQNKAIHQGWKLSDLTSAISTQNGPRRNGGRSPKIPSSLLGVYGMIVGHCESWHRWNQALKKKWDSLERTSKMKHGVTPQLKELIDATAQMVNKLLVGIEAQLSKELPERNSRQDIQKQRKVE